jgi:cytochrome c-type biogenesis protein CcmH/NrfG
MTDTAQTGKRAWTRKQAAIVSALCLIVGIAGGWSIRRVQSGAPDASPAPSAKAVSIASPANEPAAVSPTAAAAQLKEMADTHAAPLLERLQSNPQDPALLANIGNIYYDAQQYPTAVPYYERALKLKPSDAAVRTDMATAFWYMGDADKAITEFNQALGYEPDNPNTLFNLGVVKWKGKKDGAGAAEAWRKLLAANPNYDGKGKVEQMLAEVNSQTSSVSQLKPQ